jgi:hypothetical protein
MTFKATKIGRCDCCFHPDANNVNRPLEVTRYDAGGGDMQEQQLCADCTGRFLGVVVGTGDILADEAATRADQIVSLSAIGDMHTIGNVSLPIAFFKSDGSLRSPPWEYLGLTIDLAAPRARTLLIVVPLSALARPLNEKQTEELLAMSAALREAFQRIVPEGWTVIA